MIATSREDQKLRWVSDIFFSPSPYDHILKKGSLRSKKIEPHCEMGYLSGKKIEVDCLRTVESLRGRLLAERQASRIAKEDGELMGNKLIELESKLREETKVRDRAERKLEFLKKKLESLNLSSISGKSEQSSSSEKCENSCRSYTASSAFKGIEEKPKSDIANPIVSEKVMHNVSENPDENQLKSHAANPVVSEDLKQNVLEVFSPTTHISPFAAKDSNFYSTDNSSSNSNRSSSSKFSVVDNMDDHQDYVDNSLALVLVDQQIITSLPTKLQPVDESVIEALVALRHAKEMLAGSMERRHMMIRIRPNLISHIQLQ
ncbi:myosin heavy chain, cardiac muscle isoform-like isoform X1 [Quillaja saponaria]|uniref:Myosin heavy chain, cardiac muscle isoform-like isoform X1 n=1 Tax=Quillaja saponaria TaxID=32244 RepID=A0AAD7Q8Y4_QUISA|nr:myosin heavy chain, cardiac muscle isoform-like isoform X1 [Quillaja saponaria]